MDAPLAPGTAGERILPQSQQPPKHIFKRRRSCDASCVHLYWWAAQKRRRQRIPLDSGVARTVADDGAAIVAAVYVHMGRSAKDLCDPGDHGATDMCLTRGVHGAWGGGPACGRSIGGRNARSRERCCAAPAAELLGHQSAAALLLRRSGWGDKAQLAVRPKRSRAAIEDAHKRIRRGKKVNMSSTYKFISHI